MNSKTHFQSVTVTGQQQQSFTLHCFVAFTSLMCLPYKDILVYVTNESTFNVPVVRCAASLINSLSRLLHRNENRLIRVDWSRLPIHKKWSASRMMQCDTALLCRLCPKHLAVHPHDHLPKSMQCTTSVSNRNVKRISNSMAYLLCGQRNLYSSLSLVIVRMQYRKTLMHGYMVVGYYDCR